MSKHKEYEYAKQVAFELCDGKDQMRYVLTALATAVQERLGEDVILCPRKEKNISTKAAIAPPATVFSLRFIWKTRIVWRHYIYYGPPGGNSTNREDLLHVTLNVAHELGLLILDRGPGRMNKRIGLTEKDLKVVRDVEADWFALCILQMYGFLFQEK